jgi:hypothetical protein
MLACAIVAKNGGGYDFMQITSDFLEFTHFLKAE